MAPWTLKRLERAVENFSAQLQCAICLCAYDNPVSLPCNHCFCEECIHRALELKALCPICKTPAKKRRLRYDTTVQELLRATEMLCSAPAAMEPALADSDRPVKTEKEKPKPTEKKRPPPELKKDPTQVKVAAPAAKVAAIKATTPERRTPTRRASPRQAKRNSQKGPPSPPSTLMEMWMGGGSVEPKNGLKIKKEEDITPVRTSVRRASPRRALTQEMNSQVAASQMSPALFEVSSPGVAKNSSGTAMRRSGVAKYVDVEETQLGATELNQQTLAPRRRRSVTDAILMDPDVASEVLETQLEAVEPKQQLTMSRRRRQSDADEDAVDVVVPETQLDVVEMEREIPPQRQSATNLDAMDSATNDKQLEAGKLTHQTPTPRKRRRADRRNGVTLDVGFDTAKGGTNEPDPNGKLPHRSRTTPSSSLTVDSQAQVLPNVEVFQVGDLVDVIERQWVGINKLGGAARITKVHGDGFYAVKFVIGPKDNRVPGFYIRRPAEDIVSDSTPSRAARKRQRRRPSDTMISPDLLTFKTRSSPHSANMKKIKIKAKPIANGKHSGMVFLCSGFKEDRMQQIDEWAELLGAEVVRYWSNDVTHLIVQCVSGDEADGGDPSMDDSDSESSPQGQKGGKRKLFGGDHRSGRWVKIRSLKYLKALVGGRWIVSDEWLQACADHGGYVSEVSYEADGHWKGRRIDDAVKRSRLTREKLLALSSRDVDSSNVGTMLFADFCFHVIGDFLPPMPPITELNTLLCMGGGKLIAFLDEIPDEMQKPENRARKLIIVSDKINPIALRQHTRQLQAQPQVRAVTSTVIVNYLWVINSISEAKLREFP